MSDTVIFKYPLGEYPGRCTQAMPESAQVVHVGQQHGVVTVWALVDPDAPKREVTLRVVATGEPTGHRADSLDQRRQRLRDLADAILDNMGAAVALVVVEGPSVMSKGGSNWDRAGLWWLVLEPLVGRYPVAVAAPTVVKKWAAGKGNADKAAVAVGVARLWPEVEGRNDNEWDALALATMGAQRLGLQVPSRAHHADALTKVAWPTELPGVAR